MVEGKDYLVMQPGSRCVGNVSSIRYRVDVNALQRQDAAPVLNEIGRATWRSTAPSRMTPIDATARPGASSSSTA